MVSELVIFSATAAMRLDFGTRSARGCPFHPIASLPCEGECIDAGFFPIRGRYHRCRLGLRGITVFNAAWNLREAIRTADTETIANKVDWLRVRASLRNSLAQNANLRPKVAAAGRRIRPTLWQRVRLLLGGSMVDRFINTYITPEGLPKLYRLRQSTRDGIRRVGGPQPELDWRTQLSQHMARLRRAEFVGWASVVIEVVSATKANRTFEATFDLIGFEWKLTRLVVNEVTEPHRLTAKTAL